MQLDFTDHAASRMSQRDVTEEEVREALSASPSSHSRSGRHAGRWEARRRFEGRVLVVIYTRPQPGIYKVITVEWESAGQGVDR